MQTQKDNEKVRNQIKILELLAEQAKIERRIGFAKIGVILSSVLMALGFGMLLNIRNLIYATAICSTIGFAALLIMIFIFDFVGGLILIYIGVDSLEKFLWRLKEQRRMLFIIKAAIMLKK